MKKRIIAVLLCMCMMVTMLPMLSFTANAASTYEGWEEIQNFDDAYNMSRRVADVNISKSSTNYITGSSISYAINVNGGSTPEETIYVKLYLYNCSIDFSTLNDFVQDYSPICINGYANVSLYVSGTCSFTADYEMSVNPVFHPGIHIPETSSLYIFSANGSVLDTTGQRHAAGIGANNFKKNGSISILSYTEGNHAGGTGVINATGGYGGAGIGSSSDADSSGITIYSGIVNAFGGANAAGIGGGYKGDGSNIQIKGGIVNAFAGTGGAAIGGGALGKGFDITISGGHITAALDENSGSAVVIGSGVLGGASKNILLSFTNDQYGKITASTSAESYFEYAFNLSQDISKTDSPHYLNWHAAQIYEIEYFQCDHSNIEKKDGKTVFYVNDSQHWNYCELCHHAVNVANHAAAYWNTSTHEGYCTCGKEMGKDTTNPVINIVEGLNKVEDLNEEKQTGYLCFTADDDFSGMKGVYQYAEWNGKMQLFALGTNSSGEYRLPVQHGKSFTVAAVDNAGNMEIKTFKVYITSDVTFVDGDKTTVYHVAKDKLIDKKLIPRLSKKDYYERGYWSPDPTSTVITGDTTFTAIYTPIEYNIRYDLNTSWFSDNKIAGYYDIKNSDDNPKTYNVESQIELNSPENLPLGYELEGWYTGSGDTQKKVSQIEKGSHRDLSLKANYKVADYKIIADANGGFFRGQANNSSQYTITTYTMFDDSDKVVNTKNYWIDEPTKIGYEFTGWTYEGQETPVLTSEVSYTIAKGSYGARYIKANWKPIDFKLDYNVRGGKLNEAGKATYTAEESFTLPSASRDGYKFLGWTDFNYLRNPVMEVEANTIYGDVTLAAWWEAIEYPITYDLNGGIAVLPKTYTADSDTAIENPSRAGYEFLGWTYEGQSTPVKNFAISRGTFGALTLTANWSAISFEIKYLLDGGINSEKNPSTYTAETLPLHLADPEKTGYDFVGWTYTDHTTPEKEPVVTTDSYGTLYFYANWKLKDYSIRYNLKGGTNSKLNPESYTIYSDKITISEPTKDNCTFLGWTYEGQSTPVKEVFIEAGSAENKEYIANWKWNAPQLGKTDETIDGKADGLITGTDNTMEQLIDGAWTSELVVTNLPAGTYTFRTRADAESKSSDPVSVTIGKGRKLVVTMPVGEHYSIQTSDNLSVGYNGAVAFRIIADEGYTTEQLVVKANDIELTAANGTYNLYNIQQDINVTVSGIADTTAPSAAIVLSENTWKKFLNTVTFGLFFKDTQTVEITAADSGSGIAKVEYQLSDTAFDTENDITDTWTELAALNGKYAISLDKESNQIVYVRVTDIAGNQTIVNSDGIVIDKTKPQIIGIENNGVYYGNISFEVTDINLASVTDGETALPFENGKYTIKADNALHTIAATDAAGNKTEYSITVYMIHTVTFNDASGKPVLKRVNHGKALTDIPQITHKDGYDKTEPYWDVADFSNIVSDVNVNAVYTLNSYNIILPQGEGYTLTPLGSLSVNWGESFTFTFSVKNGYSKTDAFEITADNIKLLANDDGSYTVKNIKSVPVIIATGIADTTAPSVKIALVKNSWETFLNTVTFGLFFKDTQSIEITAVDFGSGIAKVEYLLSETAYNEAANIPGNWSELTALNGKYTLSLGKESKQFVYARVTDNSGNKTIVNSDGVVIYTDSTLAAANAEFNLDKQADITVAMNLGKNTLDEIKNGNSVLVKDTDYTVDKNNVTIKKEYLAAALTDESITLTFSFNPMGEAFTGTENAPETESFLVTKHIHAFAAWTLLDNNSHTRSCTECGFAETSTHHLNEGAITTEPTTEKEGVRTYSCTDCGFTKTEPVEKLPAKQENPNKDETKSPQTGDSSNMILWTLLLFVSGSAVTMLGISKKRKKVNSK